MIANFRETGGCYAARAVHLLKLQLALRAGGNGVPLKAPLPTCFYPQAEAVVGAGDP